MNILENVQAAILRAKENRQNCPICNAMIIPSGGTGDDEIWYDHDCECLMELNFIMFSDEVNTTFDEDYPDCVSPQEASDFNAQVDTVHIPIYLNGLQRAYIKYCHNCNRPDGVNSDFSECIPDPPYKYRCKYCGHSLRTHHLFGEGKINDMGRK
jgi:hypothetical protein